MAEKAAFVFNVKNSRSASQNKPKVWYMFFRSARFYVHLVILHAGTYAHFSFVHMLIISYVHVHVLASSCTPLHARTNLRNRIESNHNVTKLA